MDKGVHAFPKSISPKVNMIVKLELKLTNFNAGFQHISHDAMGSPKRDSCFDSKISFNPFWLNRTFNGVQFNPI